MKNSDLYRFHHELQSWQNQGSVLALFHQANIIKFYEEYSKAVDALVKRIQELQLSHFLFEGQQMQRGEDGMPVMLEGKTIEQFDALYSELMEQPVNKGLKLLKPN